MARFHCSRVVLGATIVINLMLAAEAQQGGGSRTPAPAPTPTPTPTPTSPTSPGRGTQTGTRPSMDPSFQDVVRPMYLQGRVMLDDGTAPPEPVQLMLICNGRPRPQGHSDLKGRFSVTLGENRGVFADASIDNINDAPGVAMPGARSVGGAGRGGVSERELMGCEFRAELPGFRSDVIQLAGRRLLDNPDVGTLVLHRLANVVGFTYSMTSANAPKDARKALEKGQDLLKKQKYPEAEPQFRKAVDLYPKYAVAWYELGRSLAGQKKDSEAGEAFAKSIEADDKFIGPHLSLLQASVNQRDWKLVAERSDRVLKLNPFLNANIWFMNGVANYNLRNLEGAEKAAREALKLDSEHRNPRIMNLLGVVLSDKGDYAGAVEQMRGYLSFAPQASDVDVSRKQLAEWERLAGVKATAQNAPEAAKQ